MLCAGPCRDGEPCLSEGCVAVRRRRVGERQQYADLLGCPQVQSAEQGFNALLRALTARYRRQYDDAVSLRVSRSRRAIVQRQEVPHESDGGSARKLGICRGR